MLKLLTEDTEDIEIVPNPDPNPDPEIEVKEKEEVKIEDSSKEETNSEEFEKQEEIAEEGRKEGCKEAINVLTKDFWDIISHIESIIATFKIDFNEKTKDDVLEILNGVIDDLTINLGMLSKVSSLIDAEETAKTIELMAKGEQKADKIINEK